MTDLLGGQVQVYFGALTSSIEQIRTGRLRALAVTTAMRSEVLPDVPIMGDFLYHFQTGLNRKRHQHFTRKGGAGHSPLNVIR
jgi:Tripartite tricarboxylate transporter family receptor